MGVAQESQPFGLTVGEALANQWGVPADVYAEVCGDPECITRVVAHDVAVNEMLQKPGAQHPTYTSEPTVEDVAAMPGLPAHIQNIGADSLGAKAYLAAFGGLLHPVDPTLFSKLFVTTQGPGSAYGE